MKRTHRLTAAPRWRRCIPNNETRAVGLASLAWLLLVAQPADATDLSPKALTRRLSHYYETIRTGLGVLTGRDSQQSSGKALVPQNEPAPNRLPQESDTSPPEMPPWFDALPKVNRRAFFWHASTTAATKILPVRSMWLANALEQLAGAGAPNAAMIELLSWIDRHPEMPEALREHWAQEAIAFATNPNLGAQPTLTRWQNAYRVARPKWIMDARVLRRNMGSERELSARKLWFTDLHTEGIGHQWIMQDELKVYYARGVHPRRGREDAIVVDITNPNGQTWRASYDGSYRKLAITPPDIARVSEDAIVEPLRIVIASRTGSSDADPFHTVARLAAEVDPEEALGIIQRTRENYFGYREHHTPYHDLAPHKVLVTTSLRLRGNHYPLTFDIHTSTTLRSQHIFDAVELVRQYLSTHPAPTSQETLDRLAPAALELIEGDISGNPITNSRSYTLEQRLERPW